MEDIGVFRQTVLKDSNEVFASTNRVTLLVGRPHAFGHGARTDVLREFSVTPRRIIAGDPIQLPLPFAGKPTAC